MGKLKILFVAVGVVAALIGGGVLTGVLGAPSVESVENHFGSVSNETTTVATDLVVSNPNPLGVNLGGVSVDYTVGMNSVPMANGTNEGIAIETGNSTIEFTTQMDNSRIPAWWFTHVQNGEETTVAIDATVTSSTLGQSFSTTQERTIETDIIGQFNSTETRPVDANQPFVSDPVLYVNETRGSWDRANLNRQETPLDLDFTVYNPKPVPYTVSKVGYTITMNDVTVGSGETDSGYLIAPGSTETIEAQTAIQNSNLDDWWVTHLQRNQVTDLYIDFYLVVEGGGERFRIDMDSIDYSKTFETDIFGNKGTYPTGDSSTDDGGSGETQSGSDSAETTETATESATPTATATETDGGLLDGDDTATETPTPTETETPTSTPTPTESPTETDDGLL